MEVTTMTTNKAPHINVTHVPYEASNDFPEAAHYGEFLADRLATIYPGYEIDVSEGGYKTKAFVYGAPEGSEPADEDEVRRLVGQDLWEEFCAEGYKDYSA